MQNKRNRSKRRHALLGAVVLALLLAAVAWADGSIDATDKWAWATNAGWVNFTPTDGGGVTVYSDHLEGYAWGENIGWIRLGTHDGGGAHTYTNADQNTYGINNTVAGNLSGYAWGTNIGWINFAPTDGGVTIDPATGDFAGFAWSENVGWIKFNGTAADTTPYKVNTNWDPTAITLAAFDAVLEADGSVRVTWATATEIDNAGFNVYRGVSEAFDPATATQINTTLIAAQATLGQGASYELVEPTVSPGTWYYFLEDVDLSGVTTIHGPVMLDTATPTSVGLTTVSGSQPLVAVLALTLAVAVLFVFLGMKWHQRRRV